MSKTLPWAVVLFAVGLIQDSSAEPSKGSLPHVSAFGQRSTWLFVETYPPGATVRDRVAARAAARTALRPRRHSFRRWKTPEYPFPPTS